MKRFMAGRIPERQGGFTLIEIMIVVGACWYNPWDCSGGCS